MAEYEEQRANGASQIIARVKELAQQGDVEIDTCEWDGGGPVVKHARHELVVKAKNEKSASAIFSDEQLADHPGKVGTAATEAMLREMMRHLA